MANAMALKETEIEAIDLVGSDKDENVANNSKSNGNVLPEMDRYGFVGGSQYTDPTA